MKIQTARQYLDTLLMGRKDVTIVLRDVVETPLAFNRTQCVSIFIQVNATKVSDLDILSWLKCRLETTFTFKSSTGRSYEFQLTLYLW